MRSALQSQRDWQQRRRKAWDVFLDAGVSLLPLWILVFCLVFVAAAKLTGH